MSCNPAIGGIAKGTVVREVDALGGVMGRATDRARHPVPDAQPVEGAGGLVAAGAVRPGALPAGGAPELERLPGLRFGQGTVARLRVTGARVSGVETTDGRRFEAGAVVVTAGTFLRGRIHVGLRPGDSGGSGG